MVRKELVEHIDVLLAVPGSKYIPISHVVVQHWLEKNLGKALKPTGEVRPPQKGEFFHCCYCGEVEVCVHTEVCEASAICEPLDNQEEVGTLYKC